MNQVKNAPESMRLDNKRERRRGAAGRAAVLRRAPSDSDCSGETASLSADSGDRAPRPPVQPPRSGKTRSRRRGSEWEVLEGLKDGQRFEKRPDVFNGYLHKKRKWPLKGWHKRFFVVDGGILVYARSPTDVARGRLHGSVDVGLSVISAKARRRRIDIDADEFIYHLRAKTADVFRTWLNVLKTHRLYRQHLLTFGARESVPKIHAPLEDLPPTDTSSRTSITTTISTSVYDENNVRKLQSSRRIRKNDSSSINEVNSLENDDKKLDDFPCNNSAPPKHKSLCSMNCIGWNFDKRRKFPNTSSKSTDTEKQMHCTDLDLHPPNNTIDNRHNINKTTDNTKVVKKTDCPKGNVFDTKMKRTAALFYVTHKEHRNTYLENKNSVMKRSNKCTNLVKYKNVTKEPPLKRPISRCMLLGKYKLHVSKQLDTRDNLAVLYDSVLKKNNQVQAELPKTLKIHQLQQDNISLFDVDNITQRIMVSLFNNNRNRDNQLKFYINQAVKELYDVKVMQDIQPVKALFRSLLEYWLHNTTTGPVGNVIKHNKSVNKQSNDFFTKDEYISGLFISTLCQATQFPGLSNTTLNGSIKSSIRTATKSTDMGKKSPPPITSPKRDTASYEKDRKIQELEKLLQNTIYICETAGKPSIDKDIKTTRTLIDNLGKPDLNKSDLKYDSNSSTEKIQDTINHLISETAVPPDIAKEFLSAYLDVLLHDESKSLTSTSSPTENSVPSKENISCEVQTEAVVKRVSKSVTTLETKDMNKSKSNNNIKAIDPGQLYLKDILDKITTMFSRAKKVDKEKLTKTNHADGKKPVSKITEPKYDPDRPNVQNLFPFKDLIYENSDEKSVVIDISKYNLEHISMCSDPKTNGAMAITIKLMEKPPGMRESKRTHLNIKLSQSKPIVSEVNKINWLNLARPPGTNSNEIFKRVNVTKNALIDITKEFDLKPYLSSCDVTSKAYDAAVTHESEHSLDLSFKSSKCFRTNTKQSYENDDPQSCYIMSFKHGAVSTKFPPKKKVRLKDDTFIGPTLDSRHNYATSQQPELTLFEKPVPRVIDEKFILLLFENLMLLSKTIPSIHKDIHNLYMKLRKKHEKVVKTCGNIQGLSLLGKIYNEDSCCCTNKAAETQWEIMSFENDLPTDSRNKAMNTYDSNEKDDKVTVDENTSIMSLKALSAVVQTENYKKRGAVTQTEFDTTHVATSNSNWLKHKYTKEQSISTKLKCTIDPQTAKRPLKTQREFLKKNDYVTPSSSKLRQELMNEISLLSPASKVSTQSQTERKLRHSLKGKRLKKDFNIYQIFVGNEFHPTGTNSMTELNEVGQLSDELKTLYRCTSDPSFSSGLLSPTVPLRGPQAGFVSGTPGGRLASWIIESGGPLENASRELGQAQLSVQQLQRLLDALELQQQLHHDTDVSIEGASPNVKKDRRKFGLRKKKSNSKCASVELQPPHIDPSSSHMALSALTAPPSPGGGASSAPNSAASLPIACAAARPQSLPGAETLATAPGPASLTSLTPDHQLREDFTVLAKDLVANLKTIVATLICERGRLRAAMDAADNGAPGGAVMAALRTNLNTALQQNSELRSRLSRIHDASDLHEMSSVANSDPANRQFQQSLSYSSSCVSASEFFDAEEHDLDLKPTEIIEADETGVIELDGDSSSEAGSLSSEEGSASSDNSDTAIVSCEVTLRAGGAGGGAEAEGWSRRTRLPSPRPTPGGPSLWNLLYKNIGKDLSQISMPVTINEPLNMLQRLCEELEYSELLDSAAQCKNAIERMALIAAFAVSAYASSAHRAASKPFNPLLAETYECVRDDKGFRFIAEQVSHHPPISACHAESSKWCFWQEARIKTKFWGKSMEFQPTGRVHVRLLTTGDHYSWNKVTTCVHNLFGGQRWVDQYGDMHITCHGTDISCKLNFVKASSWSSSRHEVRGAVTSGSGARLRLAGRWSEALYAGDPPAARCLWRPGAMPPEHELYYGFTRFAMELNEIEPNMRDALPHTDTRLRPDQRALEEGDVDTAEQLKHQLEQSQRERRRDSMQHMAAWFRKALEGGEETWVFSGEYWKAREAGFPSHLAPSIW